MLIVSISRGQNLAQNPSIEELPGMCTFECCTFTHPEYLPFWSSPGNGIVCYFNSCNPDYGVPVNEWGYQNAHSGSGYAIFSCGAAAGIIHSDSVILGIRRGYLVNTLSSPLQKDSFYCVSFYISLADTSPAAADRIGVYFTSSNVSCNNTTDCSLCFLPYTPQIITPTGVYYTDTANWTKISAIYRAEGGETRMVIGNFNDTANQHFLVLRPYSIYNMNDVAYYLDDVSVVPVPASFVESLGKDTTVCDTTGFSYTLKVNTLYYDSVHWNTGQTGNQITITQVGDYWVDCYSGDCHSSDTIHIRYQPFSSLSSNTDTVVCESELPMIIKARNGFENYLWNTGDTTIFLEIRNSGNYVVEASALCSSLKDTFTINTLPTPAPPTDIRDTIFCTNQIAIPVLASDSNLLWYVDTLESGLDSFPMIEISQPTEYHFWVTQIFNGCESPKIPISIQVKSPPQMHLGIDNNHCENTIITLGQAQQPNTYYRWNTGDTTSTIRVGVTGEYICTASNFCGSTESSINITFIDCDSNCIYVPNAFSPNGDGKNDDFSVFVRCPILFYLLQIYDRWGEKVFESHDENNMWDGNYKGKLMPAGTYVFVLYYVNEINQSTKNMGSITLIR